jgi:uncharacterized protein
VIVDKEIPSGVSPASNELAADAVETDDEPAHEICYFAVTTAHGSGWDETKPVRSQNGWVAHAAFLDDLVERGVVVLGGPLDEGEHALLIIDAADDDEVRRYLSDDPWVAADLLGLASVQRWRVWLDGRHRPVGKQLTS